MREYILLPLPVVGSVGLSRVVLGIARREMGSWKMPSVAPHAQL